MATNKDWLLISVFAIVSTLALGVLDFAPRNIGATTAVVFPPWVDSKSAATRAADAGATLLRPGRFAFIIIVRPVAADYAAQVRRAGALMTVDAGGVGGCLSGRRSPI